MPSFSENFVYFYGPAPCARCWFLSLPRPLSAPQLTFYSSLSTRMTWRSPRDPNSCCLFGMPDVGVRWLFSHELIDRKSRDSIELAQVPYAASHHGCDNSTHFQRTHAKPPCDTQSEWSHFSRARCFDCYCVSKNNIILFIEYRGARWQNATSMLQF